MQLDRLFIFKPDLEDNAYFESKFYCWTCELLDVLFSVFPDLSRKIDIERVPFQRSKESIMNLVGEAGQSLPILVLADNAPQAMETDEYQGTRFVKGRDKILGVLKQRHCIPVFHS